MHVIEMAGVGAHSAGNPDCPFCTDPASMPKLTTHAGNANDSKKLAKNMRNGDAKQEEGTWDCHAAAQRKPVLVFTSNIDTPLVKKGQKVTFSFQAHHAISGKQAMKGHRIEKLIRKKGGEVANDTGFTVNNPVNGIWLPSKISGVSWSSLSDHTKRALAYGAMSQTGRQWHLGHHRIQISGADEATLAADQDAKDIVAALADGASVRKLYDVEWSEKPDDDSTSGDETDDADETSQADTYDAWLKEQLECICVHLADWAMACEHAETDGDDKPYVNHVPNVLLNNLSRATVTRLTSPTRWPRWKQYISRLAWEYATLTQKGGGRSL